MQLPIYDSPKVAPQVGPSGVQNIQAPNLLAPIGQGLVNLASEYNQVVQQAGTMRAEERLNQLRSKQQEYTQWVQSLNGKNAYDPEAFGGAPGSTLHETALGWFDNAAQETALGLTGTARAAYLQGAARFRTDFSGQVRGHETQQAGVVAKDTYTGIQAVEDQNIAQGGVSKEGRIQFDTINQSIARKAFAANQLSDWLGEGPEMRQARETEVKSVGYGLVLEDLLSRNNTQGAQVFFDAHRDSMDKHLVSVMETKISQAVLSNSVQAHADRIQSMGLPLDQQDAEARKTYEGNPEGQKLLQSELEHRFSIQKTAQTVAQQETFGKLWDMRFPTIPGQKALQPAQIAKSAEWSSLNGTQRNELLAQWESHAKRNENDPAVKVAQFATYMKILDDPK